MWSSSLTDLIQDPLDRKYSYILEEALERRQRIETDVRAARRDRWHDWANRQGSAGRALFRWLREGPMPRDIGFEEDGS